MDAKFARAMAAAEVAVAAPTRRDRAKQAAWQQLAARLDPPPLVAKPPTGAALHRDLTRAAGWQPENSGSLSELAETGPAGDPVLRSTLIDGQTGASSGNLPSERNDLQAGDVPLGSVRWVSWWERFVTLPDTDVDSWQLIGPEIHGHTLPQATLMLLVGADKRRRMNANAGRPAARNFDLGPITPGTWRHYLLGVRYTADADGWLELHQDGQRVVRVEGPTTTEQRPGYWKLGHYRNAAIDGPSVYDISGCRIYSA